MQRVSVKFPVIRYKQEASPEPLNCGILYCYKQVAPPGHFDLISQIWMIAFQTKTEWLPMIRSHFCILE